MSNQILNSWTPLRVVAVNPHTPDPDELISEYDLPARKAGFQAINPKWIEPKLGDIGTLQLAMEYVDSDGKVIPPRFLSTVTLNVLERVRVDPDPKLGTNGAEFVLKASPTPISFRDETRATTIDFRYKTEVAIQITDVTGAPGTAAYLVILARFG